MHTRACVILLSCVSFLLVFTAGANGRVEVSPVPEPRPLPAGGESLLSDQGLTDFAVQAQLADLGSVEIVPASAAPDGRALRLTVAKRPAEWWHAQVKWKSVQPVAKSDTLHMRILARASQPQAETGQGRIQIALQKAKPNWNLLSQVIVDVGTEWAWYDVPLTAPEGFAAGELQVVINWGYYQQQLEIGDVQAYNFGQRVTPADLPRPIYSYPGREADAPWRAEAVARIEKLRKGDLVVRVVDSAGKSVQGAEVKVEMLRHAFGFGTCVNDTLERKDADGDRYREKVRTLFNEAVFEGAMKWTSFVWNGGHRPDARMKTSEEQAAQLAKVDRQIAWLHQHGIGVRGHNLVWPGWGTAYALLPPYLKPMVEAGDKDAVRAEIDVHITKTARHFSGRLIDWDVTNETIRHHDLQDLLSREEMVRWYKLAREADPSAKLYINDFCVLSGGAVELERIDKFYDEVKFLLDRGAPIDGIGEQAHFGWTLVGIPRMLALLDRFAGFGLPIKITEFDVGVSDEQLQADFTRDFYTAAFSHPAVESILMWGFWERSHWKPEAAMFRADWSPRPSAKVYQDLVFRQWWTNLAGQTDATGQFRGRGFLGEYTITVTHNNTTTTTQRTLDREGETVTIQR